MSHKWRKPKDVEYFIRYLKAPNNATCMSCSNSKEERERENTIEINSSHRNRRRNVTDESLRYKWMKTQMREWDRDNVEEMRKGEVENAEREPTKRACTYKACNASHTLREKWMNDHAWLAKIHEWKMHEWTEKPNAKRNLVHDKETTKQTPKDIQPHGHHHLFDHQLTTQTP